MFGLGSICDKLAGEVIPEEYMWIADLACGGVDVATGNYGNAVTLGIKAGADGMKAGGNKDLAQKVEVANTTQSIIAADALNQLGKNAATLPSVNACTDDPEKMFCSNAVARQMARQAGFATGGLAIGAAKGGKASDYQEGLAIGRTAAGLTNSCLTVAVDPKKDTETLLGNAALLGRDTAAFATAIAVAEKKSEQEKRLAGAAGGAVGAGIDLPAAAECLTQEKSDLERLLAVERTAADVSTVAFDVETAKLNGREKGDTLRKAQTLAACGFELTSGPLNDEKERRDEEARRAARDR